MAEPSYTRTPYLVVHREASARKWLAGLPQAKNPLAGKESGP